MRRADRLFPAQTGLSAPGGRIAHRQAKTTGMPSGVSAVLRRWTQISVYIRESVKELSQMSRNQQIIGMEVIGFQAIHGLTGDD